MAQHEITSNIPVLIVTCLIICNCVASVHSSTDQLVERKYGHKCNKKYYIKPKCIDNPDVYTCKCGAGFYWNKITCIAEGIDSYLVFNETTTPLPYTQLQSKIFHEKKAFTIALWLSVQHHNSKAGTVLSYTEDNKIYLRIITATTLCFQIHAQWINTTIKINDSKPFHLAWTWSASTGKWTVNVDGSRIVQSGFLLPNSESIPEGKDLVLGQTLLDKEQQVFDFPFQGAIAFLNIWNMVKSLQEIIEIYEDCQMMKCGNDIQWTDFRVGTKGGMLLKWPSGIFKMSSCFSPEDLTKSCDNYCNDVNGAQCKAETVKNVHWERTSVNKSISFFACPTYGRRGDHLNETSYATRECVLDDKRSNIGKWNDPVLKDCIPIKKLQIYNETKELNKRSPQGILNLLQNIRNLTKHEQYYNIFELASLIETLHEIIKFQSTYITDTEYGRRARIYYGLNRSYDSSAYPSFHQTKEFVEIVLTILNDLVDPNRNLAWSETKPPGAEGDRLFQVVEDLAIVAANSLRFHMIRGEVVVDHTPAYLLVELNYMTLNVSGQRIMDATDVVFPARDKEDKKNLLLENRNRDQMVKEMVQAAGTITFSTDQLYAKTKSDYFAISLGKFYTPFLLPNHNVRRRSKENNVNSPIYLAYAYPEDLISFDFNPAITIETNYLDNFNISNTMCASLKHGSGAQAWKWMDTGCVLVDNQTDHATCNCSQPGIYTVITDMYNINWKPPEERAILLDVPSYIGCSISALLCFLAFVMLIYLRTSSPMASVHKNFAIAIVFSQLSFMFGIDKYESGMLCHVFAICLHYFILASFFWLMNETVSLYTVIVYAAQSKGEHMEGGSNLRYYILGWVFPGVLVGGFIGAHVEDYYAPDMCWIAWKHVWLFLGPILGLIAITLLVLVFIAKEHAESSYTNSEKTNKMLIIHSRALWTQVILLTICWTFALLSIRMSGIIIKVLYGLFNCAQGAFFFVFYFLLNDEVRKFYKSRTSKRSSGDDDDDDYQSSDAADAEEMQELTLRIPQDGEPLPGSVVRLRDRSRQLPQQQIDYTADENEGSDCEMMVTTV